MNYKPEKFPGLIPYFVVRKIEESIKFYQDAFGFKLSAAMKDELGNIQHAEMTRNDVVIMFCPEGVMGMSTKCPSSLGTEESISLYCYCEDVDLLYKKAISIGAKTSIEPSNMFWGDRMCALVDHDGYRWSFATFWGVENSV